MEIKALTIENGDFVVRLMTDVDAPGVVGLYRAVYGEFYPMKEMYDPEYILQRQEAGLMYRVVVVGEQGKVLATQAIYRTEDTHAGVFEGGHGMVHPEYRSRGFMDAIFDYIETYLLGAVGVEVYWGEAVANHIFMQKSAVTRGYHEMGIEIDLMPAASFAKEGSAKSRVSTVLSFRSLHDRPHRVYIPEAYQALIASIYQVSGVERDWAAVGQAPPNEGQTRLNSLYFPPAGVARITVHDAGADLLEVLERTQQEYLQQGALVFQVYFSLGQPWADGLAQMLNSLGYFYAALMPRWFDADGLLMQKLVNATDYDQIQLYSDRAREILQFIVSDRERVEELAGRR